MKPIRKSAIAGAATLAVVSGGMLGLVAQAHATTTAPSWEPDPVALGTLTLLDSTGTIVTSGTNLNHVFDFAAASTDAPGTGFSKGTVYFAAPNHSLPTYQWYKGTAVSSSTTYPVAAPSNLAAYPYPVANPAATEANLTSWLGGASLDTTAGYANIVEVRVYASGAGGKTTGTNYWNADIAYNTTSTAMTIDNATVPANGWAQVYPTNPTTTAGAPTNVATAPGNGQVSVAFSAPAGNGGAPVTSYTVTETDTTNAASPTSGQTFSGPASPIVATGLTNGDVYAFTVTATNLAGTGPASSPAASGTPAGVAPGAPSITLAAAGTPGSGTASVTVAAPANNGGGTISSYTVTAADTTNSADPSNGKTGTAASAGPVTVSGLTNGDTYTFTATATNQYGTSQPSSASSPVTLTVPTSTSLAGPATATQYGTVTYTATDAASNGKSAPGSVEFDAVNTATSTKTVLGTVSDTTGTATLAINSLNLTPGSYNVTDTFTPTNTTYLASTSQAVALTVTAPACAGAAGADPATGGTCSDPQNVQVTVDPGSISITTPYTAAKPFVLPDMQLTTNAKALSTKAPFPAPTDPQIVVHSSLAGNPNWTANVSASDLTCASGACTSPVAGEYQTINGENFGFTGLSSPDANGSATFPGTLTLTNNPGPTTPFVPSDASNSAGIKGKHAFAASNGGGNGSVTISGTLTLVAPTATQAGVYTGVLTFTVG